MQIAPAVLEEVRRLTADVLQIEIDEIRSESQFFGELGAESLELLELKKMLDTAKPPESDHGPTSSP